MYKKVNTKNYKIQIEIKYSVEKFVMLCEVPNNCITLSIYLTIPYANTYFNTCTLFKVLQMYWQRDVKN